MKNKLLIWEERSRFVNKMAPQAGAGDLFTPKRWQGNPTPAAKSRKQQD